MNANESRMSRRTALKLSASFTAAAACMPLQSVFADDDGPVSKVLFTNVNVFDGLSSTLAEGMYEPYGKIPANEQATTYLSHVLINHYEITRRMG